MKETSNAGGERVGSERERIVGHVLFVERNQFLEKKVVDLHQSAGRSQEDRIDRDEVRGANLLLAMSIGDDSESLLIPYLLQRVHSLIVYE